MSSAMPIPTYAIGPPTPDFIERVEEIRKSVDELNDLFWDRSLPDPSANQYLHFLAKCYEALTEFDEKEAKIHA